MTLVSCRVHTPRALVPFYGDARKKAARVFIFVARLLPPGVSVGRARARAQEKEEVISKEVGWR